MDYSAIKIKTGKEEGEIMKHFELMEALQYYEIQDMDYIKMCQRCLNFIHSKDQILKQFCEFHHILFVDQSNKIRALWKWKKIEDLFGNQIDPFITNLLL